MNSFHHSRGRIFFESLCALTIAGSCAGAWQQTGASAFLPAAVAAALYGLWHLTDMRAPPAAAALETGVAEPEAEGQGDLLAYGASPPEPAVVEEAPKAPRKAKRKSKKKEAPPAPVEIPAEPVVELVVETVSQDLPEPEAEPEEEYHAPIEPLFERQPIVHQSRAVFGRKAG